MEWKTSATDRKVVNTLNRSLNQTQTHFYRIGILYLSTVLRSNWDFILVKLLLCSLLFIPPFWDFQENKYTIHKTWRFTFKIVLDDDDEPKKRRQKKQITARTVKAKDNVWEPSASFAVSSTTSTNAAHKGNEKQQQKREIINALTMAHTLAYPRQIQPTRRVFGL